MNGRAERLDAREKVIRCALEVIRTERRIAEDDGAVAALDVTLRIWSSPPVILWP